jgi:hypothetical protein
VIAVHSGLDGQNLHRAMALFKSNNFNDNSLPIEALPRVESTWTLSSDDDSSGADDDEDTSSMSYDQEPSEIHTLACFDSQPWNRSKISSFYDAQWKFLAPVFSTTQPNYDLDPLSILPFTRKKPDYKEGAFSRVFRVCIHKAHYKDPTQPVISLI